VTLSLRPSFFSGRIVCLGWISRLLMEISRLAWVISKQGEQISRQTIYISKQAPAISRLAQNRTLSRARMIAVGLPTATFSVGVTLLKTDVTIEGHQQTGALALLSRLIAEYCQAPNCFIKYLD